MATDTPHDTRIDTHGQERSGFDNNIILWAVLTAILVAVVIYASNTIYRAGMDGPTSTFSDTEGTSSSRAADSD